MDPPAAAAELAKGRASGALVLATPASGGLTLSGPATGACKLMGPATGTPRPPEMECGGVVGESLQERRPIPEASAKKVVSRARARIRNSPARGELHHKDVYTPRKIDLSSLT